MDKPKKETLEEAYERVFNYDPTIEEVEAKYDDEFNEWLDNLEVQKIVIMHFNKIYEIKIQHDMTRIYDNI